MSVENPVSPEEKVGPGHDRIEVIHDPSSPLWQEAVQLEFEEFYRAGYVSDASELADEYKPYEGQSKFIIVERQGVVVGSTRMIFPGPAGFKTIHDTESGQLTITEEGQEILGRFDLTNQGFEVGTLAVKDGYRTGPFHPASVSASLYAGLTGYTEKFAHQVGRTDRGFVLASFDESYLDNFTDAFGDSVMKLGPSQEYMGSKTTPVLIDVDQLVEDDHTGLSPLLLGLAELVEDNER